MADEAFLVFEESMRMLKNESIKDGRKRVQKFNQAVRDYISNPSSSNLQRALKYEEDIEIVDDSQKRRGRKMKAQKIILLYTFVTNNPINNYDYLGLRLGFRRVRCTVDCIISIFPPCFGLKTGECWDSTYLKFPIPGTFGPCR